MDPLTEKVEDVKETVVDYWDAVRRKAQEIKSDGCTVVADIYVDCCFEHDIHFYFGRKISPTTGEIEENPISFLEANATLRNCIMKHSRFGRWSPLAWIRYIGVTTVFGLKIWNRHRKDRP
jgi:hypothetical protein